MKLINNNISNEFIGHVGSNDDAEIYVYALDGQTLETTEETSYSKDTFINGGAASKTDNVLDSNNLPAGAYVISIKTNGSKNWDRKYIYVQYR